MNARLFGIVALCGKPTPAQALTASMLCRLAAGLVFEHLYLAADEQHVALATALVQREGNVEVLRCAGATRLAVVRSAVELLRLRAHAEDWVLLHDPAWPCVPTELLRRLMSEVREDAVGGMLAVPVADTLKRDDGAATPRIASTEDRRRLWDLQMPQAFRIAPLQRALSFSHCGGDTDEATAIEWLAASGAIAPPRLVRGSALNIRVADAHSAALAAALLRAQDEAGRQSAAA